jgi:hypothetical protein
MAHFIPVRDATGKIIDTRPKGEESAFAATLAETMDALGPAPAQPVAPPVEARGLAMIVAGLVLALIVVAGLNLARAPAPPPTVSTPAPAPPTRTMTRTVAPSPTSAPTATPAPPTQTPVVIVERAPPVQCYSVTLDVTDDRGTPIGIATGESCESQDAAQANAEAQAEQVRAAHRRR